VQQENDELRQYLTDQMNASKIVAEEAQFLNITENVGETQAEDPGVLQSNNEVSMPGNSEKDSSDGRNVGDESATSGNLPSPHPSGDVRPWLNSVLNRSNISVSSPQSDTGNAFPRVSKRPVLALAKAPSSSGASGESTPSRGHGRSHRHNALPPRLGAHQLHLPEFRVF